MRSTIRIVPTLCVATLAAWMFLSGIFTLSALADETELGVFTCDNLRAIGDFRYCDSDCSNLPLAPKFCEQPSEVGLKCYCKWYFDDPEDPEDPGDPGDPGLPEDP